MAGVFDTSNMGGAGRGVAGDNSGLAEATLRQGQASADATTKLVSNLGGIVTSAADTVLSGAMYEDARAITLSTNKPSTAGTTSDVLAAGVTISEDKTKATQQAFSTPYSTFLRKLGLIKAASDQGVQGFSPEKAAARITALQKEYIALFPTLASSIRQASVDAVDRTLRGDSQILSLLQEKDAKDKFDKAAQEIDQKNRQWAVDENRTDLLNMKTYQWLDEESGPLAIKYRSVEEMLQKKKATLEAERVITEDEKLKFSTNLTTVFTEETSLFDADVNIKFNNFLKKGNATPEEEASAIKEVSIDLAIAQQKKEEALKKYEVTHRGKYKDGWVEDQRKKIESNYAGMKAVLATPAAFTYLKARKEVFALNKEIYVNLAEFSNGAALAFPNDKILAGNYISLASKLATEGIDLYATEFKEMSPKDQEKVRALLPEFQLSLGSLTMVERIRKTGSGMLRNYDTKQEQKPLQINGAEAPLSVYIEEANKKNVSAVATLAGYENRKLPKAGEKATEQDKKAIMYRAISYENNSKVITNPSSANEMLKRMNADWVASKMHLSPEEQAAVKDGYVAAIRRLVNPFTKDTEGKDTGTSLFSISPEYSNYVTYVKNQDGSFTPVVNKNLPHGVTDITGFSSSRDLARAHKDIAPVNTMLRMLKDFGYDTSTITSPTALFKKIDVLVNSGQSKAPVGQGVPDDGIPESAWSSM